MLTPFTEAYICITGNDCVKALCLKHSQDWVAFPLDHRVQYPTQNISLSPFKILKPCILAPKMNTRSYYNFWVFFLFLFYTGKQRCITASMSSGTILVGYVVLFILNCLSCMHCSSFSTAYPPWSAILQNHLCARVSEGAHVKLPWRECHWTSTLIRVMLLLGSKPLTEPMFTQFYVVIWCH